MTSTVASDGAPSPIAYHWNRLGEVVLEKDGQLIFPPAAAVPAIYRFTIFRGRKRPAAYVGEAKNLTRRFGLYRSRGRKPSLPLSKKTTSRIAHQILRALGTGRTVSVELLDNRITDRVGKAVVLDLADKATRHNVERELIAELCASDVKVLNRNGNPNWGSRH